MNRFCLSAGVGRLLSAGIGSLQLDNGREASDRAKGVTSLHMPLALFARWHN